MKGELPKAGEPITDPRLPGVFSRIWYDFMLYVRRRLDEIQAGDLPDGSVPTGSILFSESDKVLGRTSAGGGAGQEVTFTDQAQQLADDTSFDQMRNTLGLKIGEDVQAFNARLEDVADASYTTGALLYFDGSNLVPRGIGTESQALVVSGGLPVWGDAAPNGRWEPLTNGDHTSPELIFVDGDVVMAFVEA